MKRPTFCAKRRPPCWLRLRPGLQAHTEDKCLGWVSLSQWLVCDVFISGYGLVRTVVVLQGVGIWPLVAIAAMGSLGFRRAVREVT